MKSFVGTDIIEVARIQEALEDSNFKTRVFTDKEIEYCDSKGEKVKYQSYAARFAAKEAIFKAISKQLNSKYDISWKNIEILKDQKGRPRASFVDIELTNVDVDVSLSHLKEYAIATAIATIK